MYLPLPSQPDCVAAWREATRAVEAAGHEASNVVIDIANPTTRATMEDPAVRLVDAFLQSRDKKAVETVANTIFPAGLYRRYGAPDFYERFTTNVLPKVRKSGRWSGYYFERMIQLPGPNGGSINQLEDIIVRLRDPNVRALNKFEISVFDPVRDVDNSPYGGQCLSFGSFKRRKAKDGDRLDLTVLYRNHFYVEKLLGNLIGLGRLLAFVAGRSGLMVGSLTVVSTHAQVDLPTGTKRADIRALLDACA